MTAVEFLHHQYLSEQALIDLLLNLIANAENAKVCRMEARLYGVKLL
jgi:hypothetical protein